MIRTATVSKSGAYRYRLGRRWGDGPPLLWVMLNPSTADAERDDATIRRCVGFARRWGYGAISVGNLYALRATDPDELIGYCDPEGPANMRHLRELAKGAALIVVAWGGHKAVDRTHAIQVTDVLRDHGDVKCLGLTKGGAPLHPLRLPADATLVECPL